MKPDEDMEAYRVLTASRGKAEGQNCGCWASWSSLKQALERSKGILHFRDLRVFRRNAGPPLVR